jgi:pimeloyl-ACP methyl ester carboxylesterase
MKKIFRNKTALAFDDVGQGDTIVLVHGWACNHQFLAHQCDAFRTYYRVVTVDLRGHGESDAPEQEYTLKGFADDLVWMCAELGVRHPVFVGHGMGGNIILELSARFPGLARGVAMIDSVLFLPVEIVDAFRPVGEAFFTNEWELALRTAVAALFLPTDDPVRKERVVSAMRETPSHVLGSAFVNHIINYDASIAARQCHIPAAYIGAANPLVDMTKLKANCPHVMVGQTLGSGHFSTLEVPEQINSMIMQFVSLCH